MRICETIFGVKCARVVVASSVLKRGQPYLQQIFIKRQGINLRGHAYCVPLIVKVPRRPRKPTLTLAG